jgi:hypothetical protein
VEGGTVRNRSIIIGLAIAVLLVLAIAGTASAGKPADRGEATPDIITATVEEISPPTGALHGYRYFKVKVQWVGRPLNWEVWCFYEATESVNYYSCYHAVTRDELRAQAGTDGMVVAFPERLTLCDGTVLPIHHIAVVLTGRWGRWLDHEDCFP